MGASIPKGRLVVIDGGAGHFPHAERPDQFFRVVEDFLADDKRRGGAQR